MFGMVPFAFSDGVTVYCPWNGRFSFFNSPYYAHGCFTGVDVYPSFQTWYGAFAYSPVNGEVVGIKCIGHFTSSGEFTCSRRDYVILLRCSENPDRVVKILHVKPSVSTGQQVEVGVKLGTYLRSGFFDFWTDPHIHLEVRSPRDAIRARGGCAIRPTLPLRGDLKPLESLQGTVVKRRREYLLIDMEERSSPGITVSVEGETAILDGGIPHYGFFGVHLKGNPRHGSTVKLCNRPIGVLRAVFGNMGIAEFNGSKPKLNGVKVGLSLYVCVSKPQLKIVPRKPNEIALNEGEKVEVTLS